MLSTALTGHRQSVRITSGAHHQRGVAYEFLGDRQRALECWERTLELDPENKQAKDNIKRLGDSVANQSCQ